MAVFGAPVEMDDHADRALAAARDKLAELERFNEWLRQEYGFDKSFRMGIGLNTGRVMSGNVGSERRLAYTAIGDTTNTAARLEAMTKGTPYMIFMSDSTRAALSHGAGRPRLRGRVRGPRPRAEGEALVGGSGGRRGAGWTNVRVRQQGLTKTAPSARPRGRPPAAASRSESSGRRRRPRRGWRRRRRPYDLRMYAVSRRPSSWIQWGSEISATTGIRQHVDARPASQMNAGTNASV